MAHPDQTFHKIESLSAVERKEYEELKDYHSHYRRKRRETVVFYGYCVVGLVAILIIMGLLEPEGLKSWIRNSSVGG